MNRNFKKGLAIVLALVMVLAMSVTAFADTNGVATVTYATYYAGDSTEYVFDDEQTISVGSNLYEQVNAYCVRQGYEPSWTTGTDTINGEETKYLESMCGSEAQNISYVTYIDGGGMSVDWGWVYYVNGSMPYYTLTNPCHYKAMNQYTVQANDEVKIVYACVRTTWDADGNTTFELLDPSTVY